MSKELFEHLGKLSTEQRNPRSMNLDSLSTEEILKLINSEDKLIPLAVEKEIPYIAQAVELAVEAFRHGGRLIYVGAGTSGRLGILDASECPPTFGSPHEMIVGVMAGGRDAVFRAKEGSEDRADDGEQAMIDMNVTGKDVVCGIAASRRTPYVVAAINKAKELGAKTLYVTTNPRAEFDLDVDVAICAEVGPEVLAGSTRMKSGTAQKLVLNMITTTSMVRLGKIYENMMVDLQMNSRKLEERAKRVVMIVTGLEYEQAAKYLEMAGGHVKTALVMILSGVDAEEAKERLKKANGFVREALKHTGEVE
jgi:N-acetylmuramic acid 6-phosphate etherase